MKCWEGKLARLGILGEQSTLGEVGLGRVVQGGMSSLNNFMGPGQAVSKFEFRAVARLLID